MGLSPLPRRAPSLDTPRAAAIKACRLHLKDLKRVHGRAPAELAIARRSIPLRVEPAPWASFCGSPAQMCAELAE